MRDFSNEDTLELLSKGAILLDIRSKNEYCKGHIQGALLVPTPHPPLTPRENQNLRDQLWWILTHHTSSKRTSGLRPPVVVYCRKGIRAGIAKQIIKELGYRSIAWGGVEEYPLKQVFTGEIKLPMIHITKRCGFSS